MPDLAYFVAFLHSRGQKLRYSAESPTSHWIEEMSQEDDVCTQAHGKTLDQACANFWRNFWADNAQ